MIINKDRWKGANKGGRGGAGKEIKKKERKNEKRNTVVDRAENGIIREGETNAPAPATKQLNYGQVLAGCAEEQSSEDERDANCNH